MRWIVAFIVGWSVATLAMSATANACGVKRYCKQMANCAEASYYLTQCDLKRLDRDRDGIPCEKICGKTFATYQRRVSAQTGGKGMALFVAGVGGPLSGAPVGPSPSFKCGAKRFCKDMNSCAEARFYLTKCGAKGLDGNRDGIPCNSLCR
jgi:hypothetical protein